ncbi:putative bifunctional diguanylate cyclase/phosphodiesterase [Chitinimonas lacunae]|uniref:Bifunctional diguanylate cyclase/phosphodiesterase n=1 Tax=Chitinimonas lacunae TaxID=1963018 RepID=A0ABV8MJI6_9NEIS
MVLLLFCCSVGAIGLVWYFQRRQAATFAALVDRTDDPCLLLRRGGSILYANTACAQFGWQNGGETAAVLASFEPDRGQSGEPLFDLLDREGEYRSLRRLQSRTGHLLEVSLHAVAMGDGRRYWLTLRDVTTHKAAEQALRKSQEQLRAALDSSHMALYDVAANGRGTWTISPEYARILGEDPETFVVTGESWEERLHPDDREMAVQTYADHYRGKTDFYLNEYRQRTRLGNYRWLQARGSFVGQREDGRPERLVGVIIDITEQKEAQRRIAELANFDPLTGLANRNLLNERLGQALLAAERDRKRLALMFLDLDRFKTLNDTLGHSAGDRVLAQAADRLKKLVRRADILARLGGDEFVIVLTGIDHALDAVRVAEGALLELALPFDIDDGNAPSDATIGMFTTSGSIGISVYPDDGRDAETLVRNADTAMYQAKSAGRNNYKFYTADMNARAAERLSLEATLRRAFEGSEFLLHYQPQLDLDSGRIVGAEALIRWQNPKRGLVPPSRFIPVAEESRLIVPIGNWALREACRQAREWLDRGLPPLTIAVNLSALQFQQANLTELIASMLDEYGLPPSALELEVTESVVMQEVDRVVKTLASLKELGVKLAIDDFGTGYSSLAYLKRFSFDKLKIDRSFVHDLGTDRNDEAICLAIVGLAKVLGLKCIAEGVETQAQAIFLLAAGCDEMQGFLAAEPLTADRFATLLEQSRQPDFRLIPAAQGLTA